MGGLNSTRNDFRFMVTIFFRSPVNAGYGSRYANEKATDETQICTDGRDECFAFDLCSIRV